MGADIHVCHRPSQSGLVDCSFSDALHVALAKRCRQAAITPRMNLQRQVAVLNEHYKAGIHFVQSADHKIAVNSTFFAKTRVLDRNVEAIVVVFNLQERGAFEQLRKFLWRVFIGQQYLENLNLKCFEWVRHKRWQLLEGKSATGLVFV
jgi:hypothetical protein